MRIVKQLAAVVISSSVIALVGAAPPTIHVDWDESPGPILNTHYAIVTSSPASTDFPNVELLLGSHTWRIWSIDPDNPDSIGDIGLITAPNAADYSVKILDDMNGPGARVVKGIVLNPSGSHYANLVGATITGDLDGQLLLKRSGSSGGILTGDVQIGGMVTGDIDIPVIDGAFFTIAGGVEDELNLNFNAVTNASLVSINYDIPIGTTISLGTIDGDSVVAIAMPDAFSAACYGVVNINSDIPVDGGITISKIASPGYIDFHDHDVEGGLTITGGGDGDIINGGEIIGGTVTLTAFLTESIFQFT